ncbi:MAG: phosphotransferase [Bacteroidota bacterium]
MSLYTRLTQAELNEILFQYGLSEAISFHILSGGSENTNYHITTTEGQLVLSICEQKTLQQASELAHLLEYLSDAQFKTSQVVRTKKQETIIIRKERPIILKKYIEGKIIQDLSPSQLSLIGQQLAKLHQIPTPTYLPKTLAYGIEQFHTIAEYAADSTFARWLERMEAHIKPSLQLEIPKSLIHSDLFWSNIIIDTEKPAIFIMDFEEATHYYRIFDIGMTIIGICAEGKVINLEKAKQLLIGYQMVIELSQEERDALHAFTVYAGTAMTFWRHRNFNQTKPDPNMYDHYLGLKVLVDFLMEQEEDCFFES